MRVIQFVVDFRTPRLTSLVRQILEAGTAINSHIEEAQGAESKADFIHKMSIAFKEARESRGRLRMLLASRVRVPAGLPELAVDAEELVRILTAILRTARQRHAS